MGSQTPPIPRPEASVAPMKAGAAGTSSPQRVGRSPRWAASQRKLEGVVDGRSEAQAVRGMRVAEWCARRTSWGGRVKRPAPPGDREQHTAELAEKALPLTAGRGECPGENAARISLSRAGGQLDSTAKGVDDPPQDDFARGPVRVPFQKLLDRSRFLTRGGGVGGEGQEYGVDGVEKGGADALTPPPATLGKANQVVHVDVSCPEGWADWPAVRTRSGGRLG